MLVGWAGDVDGAGGNVDEFGDGVGMDGAGLDGIGGGGPIRWCGTGFCLPCSQPPEEFALPEARDGAGVAEVRDDDLA